MVTEPERGVEIHRKIRSKSVQTPIYPRDNVQLSSGAFLTFKFPPRCHVDQHPLHRQMYHIIINVWRKPFLVNFGKNMPLNSQIFGQRRAKIALK